MSNKHETGLPADLQSGVEALSGLSLEGVRVHTNSPKPAQVQALAHGQGSEIRVAPGQEAHVPHEAWRVVQQSEGRVRARAPVDCAVNDASALEHEPDAMGARAADLKRSAIP